VSWSVHHGDCIEWLRTLPDDSLDGCVTDPPYGLGRDYNGPKLAAILSAWMAGEEPEIKGAGFMGRAWDAIVPSPMMWAELYRVLKPGAYAIVFAGERTVDLMGVSLALAGFERVHLIGWVTWHSFRKSMDISKAIDAAAGAEREVVGVKLRHGGGSEHSGAMSGPLGTEAAQPLTAPATDAARQWEGWGTALKKCIEPAILIRKPREGTYANNVLTHGVGGLNVDGCRHWYGDPMWLGPQDGAATIRQRCGPNVVGTEKPQEHRVSVGSERVYFPGGHDLGRWPSNLLYCPVPSTAEREAGLSDLPAYTGADITGREAGSEGIDNPRASTGRTSEGRRNVHPTPKPIALLRRLCRLITPPGGTVIDPFTGSGSTGCAAAVEGFDFLGCELNDDPEATPPEPYVDIARARIAWWAKHGDRAVEIHTGSAKAAEAREAARDAGQLSIFGG
jgi:site-specific DNA-methyltransferase (adenine-specific)